MEEDQVAGGSSSRGRSRDDAEAQLESAANPGGTQTRCGENSSPQGHGLLPWDLEGAVKRGIVGGSEGRRESISKTMLKDALSCHRVTRPDVQIILEDGTLVAMAHYGVLSAALGSEEFSDKIEVDEGGGRGGADILKLRMPHGVGAVAARGMLELLYVGEMLSSRTPCFPFLPRGGKMIDFSTAWCVQAWLVPSAARQTEGSCISSRRRSASIGGDHG